MSRWGGMLPQHACKKCGKPLNSDGGHPAELYLGTYTGLCYPCQNAGPYVKATHEDGAVEISYPPHNPAWRRDRVTFTAYLDCEDCGGYGRRYESRSFGAGGGYYAYCKTCIERFMNYPKRQRFERWRKCIYAAFAKELKELREQGLTDHTSPESKFLYESYLDRHKKIFVRARRLFDTRVKGG